MRKNCKSFCDQETQSFHILRTLTGKLMKLTLKIQLIATLALFISTLCIRTEALGSLFVRNRFLQDDTESDQASSQNSTSNNATQNGTGDANTSWVDVDEQANSTQLWVCRWFSYYFTLAECSQEPIQPACVCFNNSTCIYTNVNRCSTCMQPDVISVNNNVKCGSSTLMGKYTRCKATDPSKTPPCQSETTRGCQCFNSGRCTPTWVNPCNDCKNNNIALVVQNGACPPYGITPRIY